MKYRKIPRIIDAIEWKGTNLWDVIDFCGGLHPSVVNMGKDGFEKLVSEKGLKIFTLEGSHMATIGDMIIRGVQGENYPCKPDIFAETYEKVDEDTCEHGQLKTGYCEPCGRIHSE